MNRILMAGVATLAFCAMFTSPVVADKADGSSKATPVAEALPAPDALKINDGEAEGHKRPIDVYKKAVKASKAGDLEALKSCFEEDSREYMDNDSYEKDGDKELTYAGLLAKILKNYSEDAVERAQGRVGYYAVVAVKNGEAANLIRCKCIGKWDDEAGGYAHRNWYLATYNADDYRLDYNAPGVKEIRDAIEKGDVAKLKEHLSESETPALELISGVEEGIDGYALLLKRLKKLTASEAKPTIILNDWNSSLAYWFHTDKEDKFIVLHFSTAYENWDMDKRFTKVEIAITDTNGFMKSAGDKFQEFVGDWDW